MFDLMRDPEQSPNTLEAIRPNLAAADQVAISVRSLPEVSGARTLSSFVPADQPEKLAIIADAKNLLDLAFNPLAVGSARVMQRSSRASGKRLRRCAEQPHCPIRRPERCARAC